MFDLFFYWIKWIAETRYPRTFLKANHSDLRMALKTINKCHGESEDKNNTIKKVIHKADTL